MEWTSLRRLLCLPYNGDEEEPSPLAPVNREEQLSPFLAATDQSPSEEARWLNSPLYASMVDYYCRHDNVPIELLLECFKGYDELEQEVELIRRYGLAARPAFLSDDVLRHLLLVILPETTEGTNETTRRRDLLRLLDTVLSDPLAYEEKVLIHNALNLYHFSQRYPGCRVVANERELCHLPSDISFKLTHDETVMVKVARRPLNWLIKGSLSNRRKRLPRPAPINETLSELISDYWQTDDSSC